MLFDSLNILYVLCTGKYVSVNSRGDVTGRADAIGPQEQIDIVVEDEKTALQGHNGYFLAVNESGELRALSSKAKEKEIFQLRTDFVNKKKKKDDASEEDIMDPRQCEVNYVKQFQSFQDRRLRLSAENVRKLEKAKNKGKLHEAMLDRREKMKADRYCKVQRSFYVLDELLQVTEDRNYEFKAGGLMLKSNSLKEYVQKYGSAFLNSEGGVLLGGVRDDGRVIGVFCSHSISTMVYYTIKDEFAKFRPPVQEDKYRIVFMPVHDYRGRAITACKVIELHIYKGDNEFLYESGNHEVTGAAATVELCKIRKEAFGKLDEAALRDHNLLGPVFIRRDGGVQGPLRPLAIKDVLEQKYQKILTQRRLTTSTKEQLNVQKENANLSGNSRDSAKAIPQSSADTQEENYKETSSIKRTVTSKPVEDSVSSSSKTSDSERSRKASDPECSRKRKVQFVDLTQTDSDEDKIKPVKINRTFKRFFDDVRTRFRR
eukprot:gene3138-1443_t